MVSTPRRRATNSSQQGLAAASPASRPSRKKKAPAAPKSPKPKAKKAATSRKKNKTPNPAAGSSDGANPTLHAHMAPPGTQDSGLPAHPGAFYTLPQTTGPGSVPPSSSNFNSGHFFAHQAQIGSQYLGHAQGSGGPPFAFAPGYPQHFSYPFPIDPTLLRYGPSGGASTHTPWPAPPSHSSAVPSPAVLSMQGPGLLSTTESPNGPALGPVEGAPSSPANIVLQGVNNKEQPEAPFDAAVEGTPEAPAVVMGQGPQDEAAAPFEAPLEGTQAESTAEDSEMEDSGMEDDPADEDDTQDGEGKEKRVYPSDCNPEKGYIDGVCRGDIPYDMAHKRGLKDLPKTQRKASRLFNDQCQIILTRCEDLSIRSASWIYVAMQHPKAKQPFTHFALRRLRKEAPEELKKIHKEVPSMMKVLLRANHSHTLDFTREQEQAARKVEEASQQVQEASRQVQDANERASKAEEEAERLRKEMAATQYILSSVLGAGASGTASTSSNPM